MNLTQDSYPYITGMGIRNRCHMIFDEFRKDEANKIKYDGQVIFIKTDLVNLARVNREKTTFAKYNLIKDFNTKNLSSTSCIIL